MHTPILIALCLAAQSGNPRQATPPASAPLPPAAPATEDAPKVLRGDEAPSTRPTRSVTAAALDSQQSSARPLRDTGATDLGSLFAVKDPEPRTFAVHDLVTIVVSEQSKSKSTADAKADKNWETSAAVDAWISMDPTSFGEGFFTPLTASELPAFGIGGDKTFKGKGSYNRADDFSARVTAEVVEVRPNGLLVLEARREITNDGETQVIVLSGICRPEDVDTSNQVQSQRIADAVIKKTTTGQLRDTTEKGVLAKLIDTIFAF
ncbi:MAG: flagellar L-ring protein [Planctomycetota bacterium]|jgi:flagellar L-ring protein precursor FlgH